MNDLEYRYVNCPVSTKVEVREDNGERSETLLIEGYAARFESDSLDMGFIERIRAGAFARALREVAAGERNIRMFWQHDAAEPLGSTQARESGVLTLEEDDQGLRFTFKPDRLTPAQLAAVRENELQMSFGFRHRATVSEWDFPDNGEPDRRTLVDVDIYEVSLVTFPAYPATSASLNSARSYSDKIHKEARAAYMAARETREEPADENTTEETTPEEEVESSDASKLSLKLKLLDLDLN